MRRGKWLFHHDPYRKQSPVFQVKGNPVRITASLEVGLYPQIQVLVGDNPNDPGAVWVDWRKNDQELRLGADEATQVIIAAAGWYRLDVDDLAGTRSMVWAEDEEGTLDRIVTPVTMLRPACGGSATPPSIVDPIDVECAGLYGLLQSNSLQGGRWYRLHGVEPFQLDGRPFVVYLQAIDSSNIEWAGWLECESYTQGGRLWPCRLVWQPASFGGPRCWLEWVHDLQHRNILRGLMTISEWPFSNPLWLGNNVEYTFLTFISSEARTNSIVAGNKIFGGRLELDAGAYVYYSRLDRSIIRLERAYGFTAQLQDCTITQFSTLRASGHTTITGVFARKSEIYLYFSPPTAEAPVQRLLDLSGGFITFSTLSVNGNVYHGRRMHLHDIHLEDESTLVVEEGVSYSGFIVLVQHVELKGNSAFYARYAGNVERLSVHNSSFVELDGAYGVVNGTYGQYITDVEVANASVLRVLRQLTGPYYPYIRIVSIAQGSVVDAINCWQLSLDRVEVKNRSYLSMQSTTAAFFPVGVSTSTFADESYVLIQPFSWRLSFELRTCHFFGGIVQPSGTALATCRFDMVHNVGGDIRYDSTVATLSYVELINGGYLRLYPGNLSISETTLDDAFMHIQGNANLADLVAVGRVSVSNNSGIVVQHSSGTGVPLSVYGVEVSSGASLDVNTQAGSDAASLVNSSFSSDATHSMLFASTTPITIQGLYSHGAGVYGNIWTANYTGPNTRNF